MFCAGFTGADPSCAICAGDRELAKTTKTTGKSNCPNWNEKLEAVLPDGTQELTIKVTHLLNHFMVRGMMCFRLIKKGRHSTCFREIAGR